MFHAPCHCRTDLNCYRLPLAVVSPIQPMTYHHLPKGRAVRCDILLAVSLFTSWSSLRLVLTLSAETTCTQTVSWDDLYSHCQLRWLVLTLSWDDLYSHCRLRWLVLTLSAQTFWSCTVGNLLAHKNPQPLERSLTIDSICWDGHASEQLPDRIRTEHHRVGDPAT